MSIAFIYPQDFSLRHDLAVTTYGSSAWEILERKQMAPLTLKRIINGVEKTVLITIVSFPSVHPTYWDLLYFLTDLVFPGYTWKAEHFRGPL